MSKRKKEVEFRRGKSSSVSDETVLIGSVHELYNRDEDQQLR